MRIRLKNSCFQKQNSICKFNYGNSFLIIQILKVFSIISRVLITPLLIVFLERFLVFLIFLIFLLFKR